MLNSNLLKTYINDSKLSTRRISMSLGISTSSFYRKLNGKNEFNCTEIVTLCRILNISNPMSVFFTHQLT